MILASDPTTVNHRTRRKVVAVFFLGALVVLSSLAGLYTFGISHNAPTTTLPSNNIPVTAQVTIKVYDGSTLKQSVTQNDDMVMNNFMNYLASWFGYLNSGSTYSTFAMTDISGTSRTLVGRDSLSTYTTCTWACENTQVPYAGGYIGVGTGSTSPTRTDSKLASQYQSLAAVSTPTYDPSTGNIAFGVGIIAGSSANIKEVGFFENWDVLGVGWQNFLMFHDTFSTIAVTAGNTISVQYTVSLGSTAYNNNLGLLLAAIFANAAGTASHVSLTPTSGAAQSVTVYFPAGQISSYNTLRADLGSGATGADSAIRVGTGSTSTCPNNSAAGYTQSRSATDLCNPVLSYQPVGSYVFSPYVAITAVIPTPVANSFTEAGYYQSFGSSTYSFLLIRNTFIALNVEADSSITTTYEISMS